jgi:hypothetical protein
VRTLFGIFLCALVGVGCALKQPTILPFSFGEDGSWGFPRKHDILRWCRSEAFTSASVKAASTPGSFAELVPGENLIVIASEGYVLPLSVNLQQYWTVLLSLPSDCSTGAEIPISWASKKQLIPGEGLAMCRWSLFVPKQLSHEVSAGTIRVLSRSATKLRLQLSLSIDLHSHEPHILQRGNLSRTLDIPIRMLETSRNIFTSPKGSDELVGQPCAGPLTEPIARKRPNN